MKIRLPAAQPGRGQELRGWGVEDKGRIHPRRDSEVEMLLQPPKGQVSLGLPSLRSTAPAGSRSSLPQFAERATRCVKEAGPMRAIGGKVELQIVPANGIAEKEFRHIILP